MLDADRIRAVASNTQSLVIRRQLQAAKEASRLIDVTYRRKTRSVIYLDDGYICLAMVSPRTIQQRIREYSLAPVTDGVKSPASKIPTAE